MALFGSKLRGAERAAALDYYEAAVAVTAMQGQESDQYNAALLSHMNSLDEAPSMATMVNASRHLAESAQELRRRHAELQPVPNISAVASDYAAWAMLYLEYAAWASAQHEAFLALAAGREPASSRVQELMARSEAARARAEATSQRLLRSIGLTTSEVQTIHAAALGSKQTSPHGTPLSATANDTAEGGISGSNSDIVGDPVRDPHDLGLFGRDVPLESIEGLAMAALALIPMSRIEEGVVRAFEAAIAYGLLRVFIPGFQDQGVRTGTLPITHRDDYRALHWILEETSLPDGWGVWVTYSPDRGQPYLSSIGIALMEEEGDGIRLVKEPQQRLDI